MIAALLWPHRWPAAIVEHRAQTGAVRTRGCPICHANPGRPCRDTDHGRAHAASPKPHSARMPATPATIPHGTPGATA